MREHSERTVMFLLEDTRNKWKTERPGWTIALIEDRSIGPVSWPRYISIHTPRLRCLNQLCERQRFLSTSAHSCSDLTDCWYQILDDMMTEIDKVLRG